MKTLSGFVIVKDFWGKFNYWKMGFLCRLLGEKSYGVTSFGQKTVSYKWRGCGYFKSLEDKKNKTLINIFWLSVFLLTAFIAYKVMSFQNDLGKKGNESRVGSGGDIQRKENN